MCIKDKNLYYVGGVVRDEFLGKSSFDIDFCYEGNAIEFAKEFNIIKENSAFGTVRVIYDNQEIDIASTRTETYPKPAHLPVIDKIGCSLEEDLKRRDFTINALAKNTESGEIVDYFNGIEDLKNGKLRVLHANSFIDDPSRIIRGLKFSVRFCFDLDDETRSLQEAYLSNINYDMSYHRIKKELKETFNLNSDIAFENFITQNIYKLLGKNQEIPTRLCSISDLVNEFKPELVWLVYAGLFDLSNFELTGDEKQVVLSFNKVKMVTPSDDFEIYKLFKNIPLESVLLYAISVDKDVALRFLRTLGNVKISMNGDDLKALGIKEGGIYKEIFDSLLKEKLSKNDMTKEDEIRFVREKFNV